MSHGLDDLSFRLDLSDIGPDRMTRHEEPKPHRDDTVFDSESIPQFLDRSSERRGAGLGCQIVSGYFHFGQPNGEPDDEVSTFLRGWLQSPARP